MWSPTYSRHAWCWLRWHRWWRPSRFGYRSWCDFSLDLHRWVIDFIRKKQFMDLENMLYFCRAVSIRRCTCWWQCGRHQTKRASSHRHWSAVQLERWPPGRWPDGWSKQLAGNLPSMCQLFWRVYSRWPGSLWHSPVQLVIRESHRRRKSTLRGAWLELHARG